MLLDKLNHFIVCMCFKQTHRSKFAVLLILLVFLLHIYILCILPLRAFITFSFVSCVGKFSEMVCFFSSLPRFCDKIVFFPFCFCLLFVLCHYQYLSPLIFDRLISLFFFIDSIFFATFSFDKF